MEDFLSLFGADESDLGTLYLETYIQYDLDPSSGLSNGDTVNLVWDIPEEDIKNNLRVNLNYHDIEYKAEGLEKVTLFDPFDYVTVDFSGISPNGQVNITKDSSKEMIAYLNYNTAAYSGLSNGDKITITVKMNTLDTNYVNQFGCLPSIYEKEYEVTDLPSYITSVSDIDEATMAKMMQQAEDVIVGTSSGWETEVSMNSKEYVGNYFLSQKTNNRNIYNRIYLVYKIIATANMTDAKTDEVISQDVEYYYYVAYDNIMNIPGEGVFVDTASYEKVSDNFVLDTDVVKSTGWWTTNYSYRFNGYQTLDEIYNIAVVRNIEYYNYENNIAQ